MKIKLLVPVLLICFGGLSAAQAPATSTDTLGAIVWKPDPLCCFSEYLNGNNFADLYTPRIGIMLTIRYYEDKTVVYMLVSNPKDSVEKFDVLPENVHLFKVSEKGLEEQKRIEAMKIAGSKERRARIGAALSGAGAAFSQTTANGTATYSDGTTADYSVTVPNTQAQHDAAIQGQERIAGAKDFGASLVATELKRNTLYPGERTIGQVIFPKQKKGDNVLVEFVAGGVRYRFPMHLGKDRDGVVRDALPIELAR
jgi:hypothetical protein